MTIISTEAITQMQQCERAENMRIDGAINAYKIYNTNNAGRTRRSSAAGSRNHDVFSMSGQAGDYQVARKAVSRVPDVRQGKVDALQMQIASGQYSISADAVADKILQSSLYY